MRSYAMRRRLLSMMLVITLLLPLFVSVEPVGANPPPPTTEQQTAVSPEEMQQAIRILEPYVVRRKDGTFKLTVRNPQALGVRPEVYRNLVRSMVKTNQLVRQGTLTTDKYLNVRVSEAALRESSGRSTGVCEVPEEDVAETTLAGCPGSNYIRFHWWGLEVGLDHCATNNLVVTLAAGGTLTTVAAVLSAVLPIDGIAGELLFGLITAMIGLKAATYGWADNMYGCGSITNYPFVGPSWVAPQHC
jgi:hypothetical protein